MPLKKPMPDWPIVPPIGGATAEWQLGIWKAQIDLATKAGWPVPFLGINGVTDVLKDLEPNPQKKLL
jgi:hypothetical protein